MKCLSVLGWIAKFVAPGLLLCGVCRAQPSVQSTSARAWLVSKGEARAVLVAESHLNTALEFDSYFSQVVQPSFLAADVAFLEIKMLTPAQQLQQPYRQMPCDGAAAEPPPRSPRLQRAMEDMVALAKQGDPRSNAEILLNKNYPEHLLEDSFALGLRDTALTLHTETEHKTMQPYQEFGRGVSTQLWQTAAARNLTGKLRGLDFARDERTSFCSASHAERQAYLAEVIENSSLRVRSIRNDPQFRRLTQAQAAAEQSLQTIIRCVDRTQPCTLQEVVDQHHVLRELGLWAVRDDATYSLMIQRRSRAWLPVIMQEMHQHRKTFILVGSLHLPDLVVGKQREAGLISLLRAEGYSVEAIHGAAQIEQEFLRKARWWERLL